MDKPAPKTTAGGHVPPEIDVLLSRMLSEIPSDADIEAYRDMVLAHEEEVVDVVEIAKSDAKAEQLRKAGNRLYHARKYKEALGKYNEAICYAESDSEQLAICYANRSAIYYEQEEYELALLNMALTKAQNCPEMIRSKLDVREQSSRKKLEQGQSKNISLCPRMGINVEVNPKVPFLAKGIAMKQYPWCNRGLEAERDFRTGDVILDEKAMLSIVDVPLKYYHCSHCSAENHHSLIPCPSCVFAMYCNEECRERDKQYVHRFECGLATKLRNVSMYTSNMGPKLWLYGLTLFNDDLDRMMEFCERSANTGGNPFNLDYKEYDPLAEFKELHKTVLNSDTEIEGSLKACAALSYAVLVKHPRIESHLTTKSHHRFLLNALLHYTRAACFLMWNSHINLSSKSTGHVLSGLTSVGSLINHSCDPNVAAIFMGGRLKFILLRPIRAGEQILTAYGPTWYDRQHPPVSYSFVCTCPFCVQPSMEHWMATGRELSTGAERNAEVLLAILQDGAFNDVDKLHAIQQYIQRHIRFHPEEMLSRIMTTYRLYLLEMVKKDIERRVRDAAALKVFQ
uniref:SET and MYND domain-containing protein 4 n=1 Tax=Culex tarsalis TaxID=7177 RepID=A0A1Q3EVT7_CULTA